MRTYLSSVGMSLWALALAICGKSRKDETRVSSANSGVSYGMTNDQLAMVRAMLPTKLHIDSVQAYFRLIGVIQRHQRWIKPGQPLSDELQKALQLFPAVEWQYAECGFRPMLPFNRLLGMSEAPEVVITSGFVLLLNEGEKPVFFAKAVTRRMEKLAAPLKSKGALS